LLGKLLTLELLGVYSIAHLLSNSVIELNATLSRRVLFPTLSKDMQAGGDGLLPLRRFKRAVTPLFLLALALLGGYSELLIRLLYDARYADAAWMLFILCLGRMLKLIVNPTANATFAMGKPQLNAFASVAEAVTLIASLLVGYQLAGSRGAIIAASFAALAPTLILWAWAASNGLSTLKLDFSLMGFFFASIALLRAVSEQSSRWPVEVTFGAPLAGGAVVAATWLLLIWGLNRKEARAAWTSRWARRSVGTSENQPGAS